MVLVQGIMKKNKLILLCINSTTKKPLRIPKWYTAFFWMNTKVTKLDTFYIHNFVCSKIWTVSSPKNPYCNDLPEPTILYVTSNPQHELTSDDFKRCWQMNILWKGENSFFSPIIMMKIKSEFFQCTIIFICLLECFFVLFHSPHALNLLSLFQSKLRIS